MIPAPISTPPQAYMDIILPLIEKARCFLESGEKLQAIAFVGNLATGNVIPVIVQPGSEQDTDHSLVVYHWDGESLPANENFIALRYLSGI